ncbi:outer membrane lipoprotein LolB [Candidatus Williamhamiltonella defendens]|uniref:Outer-membrane lipoprotein LolB n=1 Tax=Candidatus Williamhamiltonella defendens TaxID=138072 RepID=A0A2D3T406_9ENTR|nr:lipoprotein insertase outer membrane protein LolB [Candidatus Hamiltonella defensa]ATW30433.1 outer membrane lipoprotein LolB [Candidatus Hamiltonella defensa]ATW32443.1 outer membrane lipoprotein LolB [Candidatus Hamiltonella defensa]
MLIFKICFYRLLPLSVLLLAACSALKAPESSSVLKNHIASDEWQEYQHQLKQIQQFQIQGSVAYFSDEKKAYARFFWQQYSPENYHLLLLSPLGQTEFELKVTNGRVDMAKYKDQGEIKGDAEEILFKLTGIPIPLEHLSRWIVGASSDADEIILNRQSRLKTLIHHKKEQTWKVYYQAYNTKITPILPERLELYLISPNHQDQRMTLKINHWILK